MNKIIKTLIGTSLAGAAIFGAVAPANAADGDRLEGELKTQSGPSWGAPSSDGRIHYVSGKGAAWSVPSVGNTGEIRHGDLCVTYDTTITGWQDVTAQPCDGSAGQKFTASTDAWGTTLTFSAPNVEHSSQFALQNGSADANGQYTVTVSSAGPTVFMGSSLSPVVADEQAVDIVSASTDEKPVFAGTGEPGSTVVVKLADGTSLGSATVAADGKWTLTSGQTLTAAEYTVTATQTTTAGTVSTDNLTFTVVGAPIADPMIAGGAATLLLAGAGALFAVRRRAAKAAA